MHGNKTGVAKIADRLINLYSLCCLLNNTDRLITDVISVDLEMFAVLIFFFHGLYWHTMVLILHINYGKFGCQVSFD